MEIRRKENSILVRAAEEFDLPSDVTAGMPRLEVLGGRELFLDNHRGILSCSDECMEINTDIFVLRVRGEGLTLRGMTDMDLRISGRIDAVELVR